LKINCFLGIQSWSDIVEDFFIPYYPNALGGQDNNLHEEWHFDLVFNVKNGI
jgi:hypothetical protein